MTDYTTAYVVVGDKVPAAHRPVISFTFPDFANLPQKRGEVVRCPSLPCRGYLWTLLLYPRGDMCSDENATNVSIFLKRTDKRGDSVHAKYALRTLGSSFGEASVRIFKANGADSAWGYSRLTTRDNVLNPANGFLVNGDLTILVHLEILPNTTQIWRPSSTLKKDIANAFNSQKYCDVTLSVGGEMFKAHKAILANRAPGFVGIFDCESNKDEPIVIDGVEPSIFVHFLQFIYADYLTDEPFKVEDAMALLDVADKFECLGLKLRVEAKMAESNITDENVLELLMYADSKNCALLKECTLHHAVADHDKMMQTEAFKTLDSPDLLRELMTASLHPRTPVNQQDQGNVDSMSVAAMRQELEKAGRDVDGTREVLAKRLETISASCKGR